MCVYLLLLYWFCTCVSAPPLISLIITLLPSPTLLVCLHLYSECVFSARSFSCFCFQRLGLSACYCCPDWSFKIYRLCLGFYCFVFFFLFCPSVGWFYIASTVAWTLGRIFGFFSTYLFSDVFLQTEQL